MRDLSVTNILNWRNGTAPKNICHICQTRCLQRGFEERSLQLSALWHRHNWATSRGIERPYPSFKCNFTNGDILKPYWALLEMTGFYRTDKELGITMDTFGHRNAFFGFDLTTTGLRRVYASNRPNHRTWN